METYILQFDQFIRSIAISRNETFSVFLGAGASITSGVPSAADCIWLWKQSIYLFRSGKTLNGLDYKSDQVKALVQGWLNSEGSYPNEGDDSEYSFYAKQCYPIESDRSKFFRSICNGKEPSVGYKIMMLLHKAGVIHTIWTTNFDELCNRAAVLTNCDPIDITLDSVSRIIRPHNSSELPIVKLHGDYRYGPLKNTEKELQRQDDVFRQALINYLSDKHLIVFGYSGRDISVMNALEEAFSKAGSGRLYWCGYGHDIPDSVMHLLQVARQHGRDAFYIPTDGFDKTFLSLAPAYSNTNTNIQNELAQLLSTEAIPNATTPFTMDVRHLNTIVKSNIFRIQFPQEVFQFDFDFGKNNRRWHVLRNLTAGKNIVAVPKGKLVWALGSLTEINEVFGSGIKDKIRRVPIGDIVPWKETALHHLLLSCLTKSLAQRANLPNNSRDKIWLSAIIAQKRFNDVIFFTHKAVRLALVFDERYYYLSLNPDFHVTCKSDDVEITKDIKQEIGRTYFEKIYNKVFSSYLNDWRKILIDISASIFEIEFPVSSATGFVFTIWRNPAFAKIMMSGTYDGKILSESVPQELLMFEGIQLPEPLLVFAPKNQGMTRVPHDFHPMRGVSTNRPFDHAMVGTLYEHTIHLGVIAPGAESLRFSAFLNQIQTRIGSQDINPQYLIDYPGFFDAFGVSIDVPQPGMSYWSICEEPDLTSPTLKQAAIDLRNKIIRQIDAIVSDGIKKVIVICIPDRWLAFTSYDEEKEHFDLHDYIKAYCAEKSISTQFIQEKTLSDELRCQINWWLSLSYFVKTLRTPWALDSLDLNTAFAGIGYSVTKNADQTNIVLGCSHIYNAQGQGLKYRLAKVEDQLIWDRMDRPHLSYKDAYRLGLSIVELFHTTMSNLPKRVVVHKRNYFMEDEINGLKDSLMKSGISDIDLIEINFEDDIRFVAGTIDEDGNPDIQNFPVARGTCILLNGREALLWTHGAVQGVKNPNYKYFLGGRFIPGPLRIIKHYGAGNIGQIANEILGLTKVNWNSFDLYGTLPATISSSNEIARIGKLLSKREGGNYDYRFFI